MAYRKTFKASDFITELLLYSGQYALFYILMNFSHSGFGYFEYTAHTVLIFALFVQKYVLYIYGDRLIIRMLGSLICPVIYTVFEIHEFHEFILNIGHFFFWAFSIFVGILNALKLKSRNRTRWVLEFMAVFMNVVIFLFVYMYFDISLSQTMEGANQLNEYSHSLSILNIKNEIIYFFKDEAHIYMTLGGVLLGISLGISQVRVVNLKEKINEMFGKYVHESIRDKIIENNGVYKEKRELCILFCDIRNFTSISENVESSIVVESLNQYFSLWETVASEYGGVINKFIGDAVMIIFGLDELGNQEDQSVACALKVLESLSQLNEKLIGLEYVPFEKIGIGIHCGDLVLGNVGSERRKEFTVIGDVVNTASRLESLTKSIDEDLVISADVYNCLGEGFKKQFEYFDAIALKGRASDIKVYKLKETAE